MPDKRLNTPVRRIERDAAGVRVSTDQGTEHFDHVVLATHSDQSLALLAQPTAQEREVLGAIRYQPTAPCCTPTPRCCPSAAPPGPPGTTSAPSRPTASAREAPVCACTTCSTSCSPCRLPSPWWCRSTRCATSTRARSLVSTNTPTPCSTWAPLPRSSRCLRCKASTNTWFCGAWTGYGFHEDGLKSGLAVRARQLAPLLQAPPKAGRMTIEPRATTNAEPCWFWPGAPPRLRPRKHAFAYGTFFLMLPMRTLAQGGSALAVNRRGHQLPRRGPWRWRSAEQGGALAWLDGLLQAEGIDDATGEVWLHTYPRVLGYTFKPVSFWYCHRADGSLRAILVEVNNTFGERHCYLLDAPQYGVGSRRARCSMCRRFAKWRAATAFASCARRPAPMTRAAPWCALITTTPAAPHPDQRERHLQPATDAPCARRCGATRP